MADLERFHGVAVIGGGVVGLAIAERFGRAGHEVVVFEAESATGRHTSSHNSGVIHAGIPYAPDTLKAKLCIEGNRTLYQYSQDHGVPHQRIGKVIVATTGSELPRLYELFERGKTNGVSDLRWLDTKEVRQLEPSIKAEAGLFSPSTGIIDVHEYMEAHKRGIRSHGGIIALSSPVLGGRVEDKKILLSIGGIDPSEVLCDVVIISAGLSAQKVAQSIEGFPKKFIPPTHFAKGHYYRVRSEVPFHHLVYPIPEPQLHGLGTHLTVDMGGYWRAGPDVMYVDRVDYSDDTFTPERNNAFYTGIRRYWLGLPDGALAPDYVGVRPKTGPPGSPEQDFYIKGPETLDLPMVLLCGIDSPGITAAGPIGDHVFHLVSGS